MASARPLLGAAAALVLAGPAAPPGQAVKLRLRPGDSLFDLVPLLRLEEFPEHTLPEDLTALLRRPVKMRSAPIPAESWVGNGNVPRAWREVLGDAGPVRYWKAHPDILPLPGGWPVTVISDGEVLPPWDRETPFTGRAAWWSDADSTLYCLAPEKPAGLAVEFSVDPGRELGKYEKEFLAGPVGTLSVADLERRFELRNVSRPCLLLPAPAAISLPVESLEASSLELSLAVLDQGFRRVDDHVERVFRASDGVSFVVEVETARGVQRVFERCVDRSQVGGGFQDCTVDLSAYQGTSLTLRLRTEAGPAGNSDFDVAVVSGLRLRGDPERAPEQPHVILVDIDTLRADRLGCYGYTGRPTSPRLDAWARENALVFRNASVAATWTLPSTASMMTGLEPRQHQVQQFQYALTEATPTLALLLRKQGYETFGLAEGGYVGASFGFDLGFDSYATGNHKKCDWRSALEWLRRRQSERPFFLFLHTYYVHAPYLFDPRFEDPESPYDGFLAGQDVGYENVIYPFNEGNLELSAEDQEYVSRMYDASIAQLDEILAPFLEELDALLEGEPRMLVITSDHGEEFFEHGALNHGQSLYNELLKVPLLFSGPGVAPGVTEALASSLDIVPTLLAAAGVPVPPDLPGRSLLALGAEARDRAAQLASQSQLRCFDNGTYKLIQMQGGGEVLSELYHQHADPYEQTDLAGAHPELVSALQEMLQEHQDRFPPLHGLSPAQAATSDQDLEHLRQLGYLQDR